MVYDKFMKIIFALEKVEDSSIVVNKLIREQTLRVQGIQILYNTLLKMQIQSSEQIKKTLALPHFRPIDQESIQIFIKMLEKLSKI